MQSICRKSAEAIANNEDLLTQILVCLPARSLLRFKCVSKKWYVIISNPKFCDRHTLQNPNPRISAFFPDKSSLYFCARSSKRNFYTISLPNNENPSGVPSVPFNFIQESTGIEIMQSCNGLLLCCSGRRSNRICRYYVVNPTTSQFSRLADSDKSTDIWGVALAFDPAKSLHYKVICVRKTAEYPRIQVELEIYSSESQSWRLGKSTFLDSFGPFGVNSSDCKYCNGAMHWIDLSGKLLHYDIDDERFGVVPNLPGYESAEYRYFGESHGHLYRVENFRPYITKFVVMEMERDYSGWSVKYHVDIHPIISAFPEILKDYAFPEIVQYYYDPSDRNSYAFVILSVAPDENEEEVLSLLLHIPHKLISYNLRDNTFKKLCDLTPKGFQPKRSLQVGWKSYYYMESLARV